MANTVEVDVRVKGNFEDIKEFIEMIQQNKLGDIRQCLICDYNSFDEIPRIDGIMAWDFFMDSRGSLKDSIMENNARYPSLESESKRLNLAVEMYSYDAMDEFSEHVFVDKGIVKIYECVDFEAHDINEYDLDIDKYNADNGTDFTKDMINGNGYVFVGGFDYTKYQI